MPFTSDNAAQFGRKGAEIANAVIKQRIQRKFNSKIQQFVDEKLAENMPSYEAKTLMRVRLQLDKVYEAFMSEVRSGKPDAGKLDRLACAQARLGEQERQLAGRPMPGSLKPTGKSSSKQSGTHATPEPIQVEPDSPPAPPAPPEPPKPYPPLFPPATPA